MHRRLSLVLVLALALAGFSFLTAQSAEKPDFHLSIISVNDSHSKFEGSPTKLTFDIDPSLAAKPVYLALGGFPYAAQVIAGLRATEENPLVIHAGDFFQGSLYFTKYQGQADVDFWNLVKPDVATLGNHEFDKGPQFLRDSFLSKVQFPLVDANVDMSADPILKDLAPPPYRIITVGKARLGVIGATTTETPYISSPGALVQFKDPSVEVQKAIDALAKQGINKTILVSHLGLDADKELAAKVHGLSLIVGGHSHSLLGDWSKLGLGSAGSYPLAIKNAGGDTTLIIQSWEWTKVVGELGVDFDKSGKVIAFQAMPHLVAASDFVQVYDLPDPQGNLVRVRWQWSGAKLATSVYNGKDWADAADKDLAYWLSLYDRVVKAIKSHPEISFVAGDPKAWALARDYSLGVQEFQHTVVAQVGIDLKRRLNEGPGPIVADAMRAYAKTQIAITNVGGIRTDLNQGPLTAAQVYELIPFGNTLVVFKAKGSDVKNIFEDGLDFGLGKYGSLPENPLLYIAGARISVSPAAAKGSRVTRIEVQSADGSWAPIDPEASYSMVCNNFMASGGDKYSTIASLPGKIDTGFVDAESLLAYVKDKTLVNSEAKLSINK